MTDIPPTTPTAPDGGFFDPVAILSDRFRAAIAAAFPELEAEADPLVSVGRQPKLGDYQSNAAMPLAKRLGKPPREVASAIIARLEVGDIAEPVGPESIAGPGFINVRLRADSLAKLLETLDTPGLGIGPPEHAQTIVIDLFGVNLAKQMHVGHLRSTIIGDALARVFERLGHAVIRQNHLGDWGLPIAMVTAKLRDEAEAGRIDLDKLTLDDLDRLYRAAQHECNADRRGLGAVQRFGLGPKALAELEEQVAGAAEALARAKRTLLKLQGHDPETVAIWRRIRDVTMAACLEACGRLRVDITDEDSAGESSYAEELAGLVEDLEKRGVAEQSEGALVVRVEGLSEPCIVRKTDGGYLYATTDLAAIRRRVQKLGADRVIYCVDARQSFHFRLVHSAAHKDGYTLRQGMTEPARLEQAAFGTVLGEDHRPFRTRSGENARLSDLIDEAVARADKEVAARSPDLDGDRRREIAEAVAVAAIKYADLSNDRVKDYVFSIARMVKFEGNTGPYLQYAVARVRSIFREAQQRGLVPAGGLATAAFNPEHPAEKTLALQLLKYPSTVRSVAESLEPHRLCQFLFELAGAFSGFYENCPVLAAPDEPTRLSRLRLCDLTARVLADGLEDLGIPVLERM